MEQYSFWIIMLIITLINIPWPVDCRSRKRRATSVPQNDEEIKQCELDHLKGFVTNEEMYREWPELKLHDAEKICADILLKFYPRTVFKFLEASIIKVNVYYKLMKNDIEQLRVNALECHNNFGNSKGREYFHFIRAPRHGCMYLLNRLHKSKKMNIAIELCNSDTNNSLKTSGKLHKAISSGRSSCPNWYDNRKLREDHERKHFKDYWLYKDVYSRWPEMELADKSIDEYCQIFIKNLYPNSELPSGLKSETTYVVLSYVNNVTVDYNGTEDLSVIVASINCIFPIRYRTQKSYQFIKAPNSGNFKCVYWVNADVKSRHYRITKHFCENVIVEVKTHCDKSEQQFVKNIWKRKKSNINVVPEPSTKVHSSTIKDDPGEREPAEKAQ